MGLPSGAALDPVSKFPGELLGAFLMASPSLKEVCGSAVDAEMTSGCGLGLCQEVKKEG